jgi:uncharacterized membrane protein (Fun14 family)
METAIDEIAQLILGLTTVGGIFLAGFMIGFGQGREHE